ncbi:hypothetical protein PVAP13_5NG590000 [Panicum virgatum]|uniref:Uncharacterized protein n=1 Tax=Panicum virgatum TaxID=38727 RepID=A0A8T0RZ93_PANVG|nr:hypothetical protein PVAP13_5NG590000 [Panicum virgatum]
MGPQAPALAVFLAAALLCLGAAAALPLSAAGGRFARDGLAVDQGIDHFLVLAAAFVVYIFR